ncbi:heavy metal-associated domain-containing protein [Aquirufa sp. HETE-83D]|uniref:Heavy metal-associated domain-containing protein n=1 Tax=Aquirufa esocilacus TaxID=3096513 RepID=A0ABW6DJI6_9BACT
MKTQEIFVENIKCAGCMTSIKHALLKITGVKKVEIDKDEEKVSLTGDQYQLSEVIDSLNSMGYPQKGENSVFKQAKSYVSCAIGKMS